MLFSFEEGALQLIGICISILGLISLFVLINQRKQSVLDPSLIKLQEEKKKYNITKQSTPTARIKVIENFNQEISKDDQHYGMIDLETEAEGFKIIRDKKGEEIEKAVTEKRTKKQSEAQSSIQKEEDISAALSLFPEKDKPTAIDIDDESMTEGFRVVGKISSSSSSTASNTNDGKAGQKPAEKSDEGASNAKTVQKVSKPTPTNSIDKPKPPTQKTNIRTSLNWDSLIDDENFPSNHPKQELDFFLQRILRAIKSNSDTNTVAFILFDSEKQLLKVEAYITENPDSFLGASRIPLGTDIISTIALTGKPTIISHIAKSSISELLPYYRLDTDIRSFIGIPITYGDSVVGILALDSQEDKAFDELTATYLGHFTKLLSGLIFSYSEKWDLKQLADSYSAISNFRLLSSESDVSKEDISDSLARTLNISLEPENIGVVLYDHTAEKWRLSTFLSSNDVDLEAVDIDADSPISTCINEGEIQDLQEQESFRLNQSQILRFDMPSRIYIIPLKTSSSVFGCFFISYSSRHPLGVSDIQMMEVLSEYAAIAMEKIYLSKIIRENAFYDSHTGLLNKNAFMDMLGAESKRASDFSYDSSLFVIKPDEYDTWKDKDDIVETVDEMISHVLSSNTREYDFLGSFDGAFYVVTVRTSDDKAKVWAEKIRSLIASEPISTAEGDITVTISTAILPFGKSLFKESQKLCEMANTLLDNTSKQTNHVALYS